MNRYPALSAADLQPLVVTDQMDAPVRPSRSYWQQAWRKLRRNRRSMASLWVLVALLIFSCVFPLLVTLDSAAQDLTQISRPPGPAQLSLIVESGGWEAPQRAVVDGVFTAGRAVAGLRVEAPATTDAVRLLWEPVPGAISYRVFRHLLPPSGRADLGLPLGETEHRGQVGFEDRLKLAPQDYYYSVLARDADGKESDVATVQVTPVHGITVMEAARRQLIPEADAVYAGQTVTLDSHWLGTDYLGRDLLARLALGGQTSLFIGLVAPFLCAVIAILYGGLSGYLGGRVDELMMRFADFVIALPFLLFMILIRVAMGIGPGESGIMPLVLALVIMGWPSAAKLVRGQVLQLRQQPFVQAARLQGAGALYLVWRHMLPNVLGVVLVSLSFAIPSAIFTEAFLSFIGMGVAPPTPSWGAMCNDGAKSFLNHPHELLLPAAFISLTVLAFNLLGDGLRDALDVRMGE